VIAASPDEGARLTHPLIRAGLVVGARRVASPDELTAELRRGAPGDLPWELVVCHTSDPERGPEAVVEAIRRSDREASLVAVALDDAPPDEATLSDILVLPADASSDEIARRVRREAELAAMRRTARAATTTGDLRDRALASMDQPVVIADAGQRGFPTVYVNPAFERMTGWSQRQILGQSCAVLQGEDTDPEAVFTQIRI
jgi:PAS domain-containing protein